MARVTSNPPASLGMGGRVPLAEGEEPEQERPLDLALERKGRVEFVGWGLGYLGLLGFTLAIVTYRLPIGDVSMIVALIGIAMAPRRIRVPRFLLFFGVFLIWSAAWAGVSAYSSSVSDTLVDAFKLWIIAFVAVNVIRGPAELRAYIVFFLLCFAVYPARGAIFNYFSGYTLWGRAIGTRIFQNPNDLAALTFFPLSIAWALVATERRGLFRWGALASVVVLPLIILLTQSRGALISMIIVGGVALLWHRRKLQALSIAAALAVLSVAVLPKSAWERFAGMSALTSVETLAEADVEGSAETRFNIWKTALLVISDYPGIGVGLGAYERAHRQYASRVPGSPMREMDAHSTYISVAAETGIPGLLLFLLMLYASLAKSVRTRRKVGEVAPRQAASLKYLELGLVAFLLSGLFGSFSLLSFLYLHMAVLWAASEIVETQWRKEQRRRNQGNARSTIRRPSARVSPVGVRG